MLECSGLCFDECILDRPDDFGREYRPLVHGSGDGLLPGLEHALHGSPYVAVDQSVCFHVCAVQAASEVDRVRRADVLHNGVKDVQGRQLLRRSCLWHCQRKNNVSKPKSPIIIPYIIPLTRLRKKCLTVLMWLSSAFEIA